MLEVAVGVLGLGIGLGLGLGLGFGLWLGLKFLIDQSILMYNANTKSHQNPYTLHYRAYSTKIRNHKHVVNKGIFTDNS